MRKKELLNQSIKEDVFQKKATSAFFIASPLQALCAIEAICDFEIEEYRIFVVIMPTEFRKNQIGNILTTAGYSFEIIDISWFFYFKIPINMILQRGNYQRAFVGHILASELTMAALPMLQEGGKVIYLDDGTASLSALKGYSIHLKNTFKVKATILNLLARTKGVRLKRYVYTIYDGINNDDFIIKVNRLRHLVNNFMCQNGSPDTVFFIGTNPEAFCEKMSVTMDIYNEYLNKVLILLRDKYSSRRIVYIPHGRDIGDDTKLLCDSFQIEYQKLDVCVEFYLLRSGINPLAVYGFGSSALYNLKCIYPSADIVNLMFQARKGGLMFDVVTDYYEQHGIRTFWL